MFKISVVIPTYNRSKMLIETLESLEYQDFDKNNFEVIVVDNNSKDDTNICVNKYCENTALNLKYVKEKRQGDIYARHTGAGLADGEILYFTDDDATFDHNLLSEIYSIFEKYPAVGAVGTRIQIVWDEQPPQWVYRYENYLGKRSYQEKGVVVKDDGLFINNGSLAIKRSIYKEVKGNNPGQVGDYLIGDAEVGLCLKLHEKKIPIAFTDDVTMWHHQIAKKNASLTDIKRRVVNNGISESYTDLFTLKKKCVLATFKNMFVSSLLFIKASIRKDEVKKLSSKLKFIQNKTRLIYYWRFKHCKSLIQLMENKDWLFDENYKLPEIVFENKNN